MNSRDFSGSIGKDSHSPQKKTDPWENSDLATFRMATASQKSKAQHGANKNSQARHCTVACQTCTSFPPVFLTAGRETWIGSTSGILERSQLRRGLSWIIWSLCKVSTAFLRTPHPVMCFCEMQFLTRQAFKDGNMEEFFRGRAVVEEVRSRNCCDSSDFRWWWGAAAAHAARARWFGDASQGWVFECHGSIGGNVMLSRCLFQGPRFLSGMLPGGGGSLFQCMLLFSNSCESMCDASNVRSIPKQKSTTWLLTTCFCKP